MKKKILILNGPNLNLLGRREPEIYGTRTLVDIIGGISSEFAHCCEIEHVQSNHEGTLIDTLHRVGFDTDNYIGVVLNAGAYTHTSLALADAIAAITLPVVEVHLSNTMAREPIRHTSLIAPVCAGTVAGFGARSYALGVAALLSTEH